MREQRPEPCPRITLVHGDAKPGNFGFDGADVSAVYDWEMATIGDPLADIGYAESNWGFPGYVTSVPGAPSADELVARWEELTGLRTQHRPWYRAFQFMKLAAILSVGGHLFEAGHSTDARLAEMASGAPFLTQLGLRELGVDAA